MRSGVPLRRTACERFVEIPRFAGSYMRPGGFEPPTRGLEVRRFVYENAGSTHG